MVVVAGVVSNEASGWDACKTAKGAPRWLRADRAAGGDTIIALLISILLPSLNSARKQAGAVVMCRSWIVAGKPPANVPVMGSFENWTTIVGGILTHVGVDDFLANLDRLYQQGDDDTGQWVGFLLAWRAAFESRAVTVREIGQTLRQGQGGGLTEALPDALANALDGPPASFQRRLGKALARRAGTRFPGGLYLDRAGSDSHQKAVQWRVQSVAD